MIKFGQSTQFINKDPLMYHGNTAALARTSNMIEELGQVTIYLCLFNSAFFASNFSLHSKKKEDEYIQHNFIIFYL